MKKLTFLFCIPLIVTAFLTLGFSLWGAKGYSFCGVTETGSMYPTIKDGDRVIVNWNVASFIDRNLTGEVLVYTQLNLCHRCILDEGDWLTAKGDNSSVIEHLTRNEIRGIFVQVSHLPFIEVLQYGFLG